MAASKDIVESGSQRAAIGVDVTNKLADEVLVIRGVGAHGQHVVWVANSLLTL